MPARGVDPHDLAGDLPNDEDVGEINRLVMNDSGKIERVVLDVGGFLGMGERQIAVTLDELNIVRTGDSDEFLIDVG